MYLFMLIAGAMALYFLVAAIQRPRPAQILAVILWSAYSVYEYYVANGTLCDSNCNIRVDLVFFFPLLGFATYLGLQKEPRTGAVTTLYVACLAMIALLAGAFGYTALAAMAGVGALIAAGYGIKSMISARRAQ